MQKRWSAAALGVVLSALVFLRLPDVGQYVKGICGEPKQLSNEETIAANIALLNKSPSSIMRREAALKLASLGQSARKAIPALVMALKDEDEEVRIAAAEAIFLIDHRQAKVAVAVLIAGLKSKNESSRSAAVSAFGSLWTGEDLGPLAHSAIAALLDILKKDKRAFMRGRAALGLGQIGRGHKEVLPALLAAFERENDADFFREAIAGLFNYGSAAKDVVPVLIKILQQKDPLLQQQAALALGNIGPEAKAAVPALKAVLEQKIAYRAEAAEALGRIGGKEALDALIPHMKDANPFIRVKAAVAVARIEPAKAAAAIPDLAKALEEPAKATDFNIKHRQARLRIDTAEALALLGSLAKPAAPALISALKDEEWVVRAYAAQTLGGLPPTKESIAALAASLSDPVDIVSQDAASALGEFGPAAKEANPRLKTLLEAKSPSVSLSAAGALARINPADVITHLAQLTSGLKNQDTLSRIAAARALWKVGRPAKAAIPDLIVALEDKHIAVRNFAAKALGQIGSDAAKSLPVLRRLQKEDPNEHVRQSAREAIKQIDR
jgi:HEAT repeat protein